MQEVDLRNGMKAIIDDDCLDIVSPYRWFYIELGGYAGTHYRDGDKTCMILMHRLVTNAPSEMEIDHVNGNGLDNRRSNLRLATRIENSRNVPMLATNKVGYKGVHWDRRSKRYRASIVVNGESVKLGRYRFAEDAALVYDAAARVFFGEFARLNFPLPNEQSAQRDVPVRLRQKRGDVVDRFDQMQQKLRIDNGSGYRGVSWSKKEQKWYAQISANGKKIHLGGFNDPVEAARTYDEAARRYHGEFARTNFESDDRE